MSLFKPSMMNTHSQLQKPHQSTVGTMYNITDIETELAYSKTPITKELLSCFTIIISTLNETDVV